MTRQVIPHVEPRDSLRVETVKGRYHVRCVVECADENLDAICIDIAVRRDRIVLVCEAGIGDRRGARARQIDVLVREGLADGMSPFALRTTLPAVADRGPCMFAPSPAAFCTI